MLGLFQRKRLMVSENILIVGSGKSYHVQKWANQLAARGYNVVIFSLNRFERDFDSRIELIFRDRLFYLLSVFELHRVIESLNVKVVYYHSAGKYASLSAFIPQKIKSMIFVYGSDVYVVPKKSIFHKHAVGYLLKRCFRIVSSSEAMKKHIDSLYGVGPKVHVIPFGVDKYLFSNEFYTVRPVVKKIGIVKKLEHVYGIDLLIQAMAKVIREFGVRGVSLDIVGSGSEEAKLREQVDRLSLSSVVTFYPAVPNKAVPKILLGFDLFVVPSRSESFGVAAVEAASVGVPVVSSDVGGLPEVLNFGRAGEIFQSESVEMLALALFDLIKSHDKRVIFSNEGIKWCRSNFDLRINVDQFLEHHNELS